MEVREYEMSRVRAKEKLRSWCGVSLYRDAMGLEGGGKVVDHPSTGICTGAGVGAVAAVVEDHQVQGVTLEAGPRKRRKRRSTMCREF